MSDPQALHELKGSPMPKKYKPPLSDLTVKPEDCYDPRDYVLVHKDYLAKLEALLSTPPQRKEEPEQTTGLELLEHITRGHTQVKRERFIECSCGTTFWFGPHDRSETL